MDFPRGRTPGMMQLVAANHLYLCANRFRVVMEIIPHEITGYTNFTRRMVCRLKAIVQKPDETSQGQKANALIVNWFFGARRDFANDRGRIINSWWMVQRLTKNLQVPVVKRGVAAISRFRLARISQIQPASQ